MSEEKQSVNINLIIKIIYKNIVLIILSAILVSGLAGFYAFSNKSFKSEINLYGNLRVLNEIGENPEFSLNSFDFMLFLKNNSKILTNTGIPEEQFYREMLPRLSAQTETGNSAIKVKFSTKNKSEAENFPKEYAQLSEKYLLDKKNLFLNSQIELLEQQYAFLSENVDIRTTKDSLSDSLVSRLAFYRLLRNDTTPVIRFLNSTTKPALNKKIVLAGGILLGLFLGIFLAFIKEFSKTLDWKEIKKK